jgi:hypothetical protein
MGWDGMGWDGMGRNRLAKNRETITKTKRILLATLAKPVKCQAVVFGLAQVWLIPNYKILAKLDLS